MPWGDVTLLDPSYTEAAGTHALYASVSGLDCSVSFSGATTDPITVSRLIGCAAMVYMPAEGVAEALEQLQDCWIFYTERPNTVAMGEAKVRSGGTVVKTDRHALTFAS
jgi:hypothetical protein